MNKLNDIVLEGNSNVMKTDFFIKKGYSLATINKYRLGYLEEGLKSYEGLIDEDSLILYCYKYIIPDYDENNLIKYCICRCDQKSMNSILSFEIDKHYYVGASDRIIWNAKALESVKPIFICETWTDALSVIDCGYEAIALNRIVNISLLWKNIKSLKRNNRFILFCDNDYYGKKANENLKNMLRNEKQYFSVVEEFPEGIKDANEWFLFDKDSFRDMLRRKSHELL